MWGIILFILFTVGVFIIIRWSIKKKALPQETYNCNICGEKECLCRKEKLDPQT